MLVLVSTVMYPQAEVYFYTDSHTNVKTLHYYCSMGSVSAKLSHYSILEFST